MIDPSARDVEFQVIGVLTSVCAWLGWPVCLRERERVRRRECLYRCARNIKCVNVSDAG